MGAAMILCPATSDCSPALPLSLYWYTKGKQLLGRLTCSSRGLGCQTHRVVAVASLASVTSSGQPLSVVHNPLTAHPLMHSQLSCDGQLCTLQYANPAAVLRPLLTV